MVKIVLITEATKRDNNNIGDIVSIHEDDVEFGDSYKTFKIVKINGKAIDVENELRKIIPEIEIINDKEYFTKDEIQIEAKVVPKYSLRIVEPAEDETLITLNSKTFSNIIELNKISIEDSK